MNLRMNTLRFFLMVLIFILVACGSSHKLSNKIARKKIQELGLVEFNDKELDIQQWTLLTELGNLSEMLDVQG